uniref:N-acetyltransferase domain-containing protein n=1 Tax=Knipowitschia caucasica TaxID=637954 RepID=A0AAV2LXU1_KNICA
MAVTNVAVSPVCGDHDHVEKLQLGRQDTGTSASELMMTEPTSTMSEAPLRAVPIHQRPDLLAPCADLVNQEWKRSQAARIHSLQKSCSEFPVCLVLLGGQSRCESLLGHSRLSRVVGQSNSLFVESVVVSKAERGKGYGRALMEETERYAQNRGFKRLYLTTHDKQHFYKHMGYVLSTPPPPCPVPPPTPPAPPKSVVQTLTQTPYTDAKGMPIYWMHKDI